MNGDLENNDKNTVLRYLCLTSEIPEGKSKSFSITNEKGPRADIAVFNINGKYHAITDTCVHKGGPLSQGNLEEVVACPWHGWNIMSIRASPLMKEETV
jgi:nitrite reductase/ring-hydroxylating ferredoxin subunit